MINIGTNIGEENLEGIINAIDDAKIKKLMCVEMDYYRLKKAVSKYKITKCITGDNKDDNSRFNEKTEKQKNNFFKIIYDKCVERSIFVADIKINPIVSQNAKEDILCAIDMAEKINCKKICICGNITDDMQIADYAEEKNIELLIEPSVSSNVSTLKAAEEIVRRHGNISIAFDIVSLLDYNNYGSQVEIMIELMEKVPDKVSLVYARDYMISKEKTVAPCVAGDGMTDYVQLLNIVRRSEKKPELIIRNAPDYRIYDALEYIEKMGRK